VKMAQIMWQVVEHHGKRSLAASRRGGTDLAREFPAGTEVVLVLAVIVAGAESVGAGIGSMGGVADRMRRPAGP
jgi:hypothetical protein